MSDVWGGSLPILYGRSAVTGELVHVDDAPNGKACGCVRPDPGCGQPLIARNNGKKRIHHFAHIGGICAWSAEYLLAKVKELGDQAWRACIERKKEERRKTEEEREQKAAIYLANRERERLAAAKKAEEERKALVLAAKAAADGEEARLAWEEEHPVQRRSIRDEARRQKALSSMDRAREIMAPIVDDTRKPARDLGGQRWRRCEKCDKVGSADEFATGDVGGVWNRVGAPLGLGCRYR